MTAAGRPRVRRPRRRSGAASTASAASSARPSATRGGRRSSPPSLLALGLPRAERARSSPSSTRQQSRDEIVDLVAAVPPILQGLAGQVVNVGTLGGYLQYKYGDVLPARPEPVVDPRAVGHARGRGQRGSLDFVASPGRVASAHRRREARRAHRRRWSFAAARRVRRRSPSPAARIRCCRVTRSASLSGVRVRRLARPAWRCRRRIAGLRARPVRRPWRGRGHRRVRHVRRVHPERLPAAGSRAGAVRQPDLVGLDLEPHRRWPAVYDWPSVALVGGRRGRAAGHRGRGVRSARHRRARPPCRRRRMPRVLLGLGGPIGRATASNLGAAVAWGLGVGLFGLVLGGAARRFIEQLQELAVSSCSCSRRSSRASTIASAGGFLQLLFVEFGVDPRRPCRGDVRRRLGVRRDVRPAGDGPRHAPRPSSLGAVERRSACSSTSRSSSFLACARHRASASTAGRRRGTPAAGPLILGVYAAALCRHRHGRWRRVPHALGRGRGGGVRDPHLVRPAARGLSWVSPNSCSTWRSPRTSASRWSASGTGAASSPRSHRDRRRGDRRVGLQAARPAPLSANSRAEYPRWR